MEKLIDLVKQNKIYFLLVLVIALVITAGLVIYKGTAGSIKCKDAQCMVYDGLDAYSTFRMDNISVCMVREVTGDGHYFVPKIVVSGNQQVKFPKSFRKSSRKPYQGFCSKIIRNKNFHYVTR